MIGTKICILIALAGTILFLSMPNCSADTTQAPVALGSFAYFSQPDGNPIVNVIADGQDAGVFAIDTGSSYDFISSSFVTKLGLKSQTILLRSDATPNAPPQSFQAVIVPSLAAGSMTWTNRPMIVVDDQQLDFPPDRPMDGIIGRGSLSDYAVLIDPASKSVAIYNNENMTDNSLTRLGFDANAPVPLTLSLADGGYHVQASVQNNGHTASVDLVVDICDGSTQIPRLAVDALHLKLGHHIDQQTTLWGDVGEKQSTIQRLILGNITVKNLPVVCLDKDITGYPPSLGRDVLFRGRVLFDFPDSKMYLAPPDAAGSSGVIGSPAAGPAQAGS